MIVDIREINLEIKRLDLAHRDIEQKIKSGIKNSGDLSFAKAVLKDINSYKQELKSFNNSFNEKRDWIDIKGKVMNMELHCKEILRYQNLKGTRD